MRLTRVNLEAPEHLGGRHGYSGIDEDQMCVWHLRQQFHMLAAALHPRRARQQAYGNVRAQTGRYGIYFLNSAVGPVPQLYQSPKRCRGIGGSAADTGCNWQVFDQRET